MANLSDEDVLQAVRELLRKRKSTSTETLARHLFNQQAKSGQPAALTNADEFWGHRDALRRLVSGGHIAIREEPRPRANSRTAVRWLSLPEGVEPVVSDRVVEPLTLRSLLAAEARQAPTHAPFSDPERDTWFDRWGTVGPQAYRDVVNEWPALARAYGNRTSDEQYELRKWLHTHEYPLTPIEEAGHNRFHATWPALTPTDADLEEPEIVDAAFIGDRLGVSTSTVGSWAKKPDFPAAVSVRPRRWTWADVEAWGGQQRHESRAQAFARNSRNGAGPSPQAVDKAQRIMLDGFDRPLTAADLDRIAESRRKHEADMQADRARHGQLRWGGPAG